MIVFAVTDNELSTLYYHDYDTAKMAFDAEIAGIEFPNDTDAVTLERVEIPINTETVFRLLNGRGGYITRSKILHEYKAV